MIVGYAIAAEKVIHSMLKPDGKIKIVSRKAGLLDFAFTRLPYVRLNNGVNINLISQISQEFLQTFK